MATKKKLLEAAAGSAGGAALNVEDVFSTYLWDGAGGTQTIVNGVDLTEGGLVWAKQRSSTIKHVLSDSERGTTKVLSSNSTVAESTETNGFTSFNSDGFTFGSWAGLNNNGDTYASWTFRKAPKFFDVITYSGTGSNQTISHNLGSTPGTIIVKATNNSDDAWYVWHRSLPQFGSNAQYRSVVFLDSTSAYSNYSIQTAQPDGSNIYVGSTWSTSGYDYVMYVFAHNDGDGEFGSTADQDIIKCGSYTGNGSTTGPEVDLGFEPQWIMIKRTDSTGGWRMLDVMRGITDSGSQELSAQDAAAESGAGNHRVYANGYQPLLTGAAYNASGGTYIYIAIRRGPMAVPESATDVFDIATRDATHPSFDASFDTVDFSFVKNSASTGSWRAFSRLQGQNYMSFDSTNAEALYTAAELDHMYGWSYGVGTSSTFYSWMWKRAPNFFDVVAYDGTGAAQNITHNLGVVPEMMWIRERSDDAASWYVWHSSFSANDYIWLNFTNGKLVNSAYFPSVPTDTQFSVGTSDDISGSGDKYIAYLFASLDGVSKVGSYTGNGSTQNIDCGFSSGARFVLIKKTSDTGGWFVYDTERGIVSGNDPYLWLDSTNAENTQTDSIDPHSSGFAVNYANTNANGATYLFYAIA